MWSGITGDKITSSPAIAANSTVYVGSNDGRLYSYGPGAPVTLVSPNGGEVLIKNTIHEILWSTTGSIVNIKLYYSLDSGDSYTLISDSEIDDGIYPWMLPDTTSSTCRVKVIAYDAGGDSASDASDADFSIGPKIAIEDNSSAIPEIFSISQNYPNPFNPYSRIRFGLPEQAYVTLTIYDILGRKVKTLMDKRLEPGYHEIVWNGKDNHGNNVSSGMYLYAIQARQLRQLSESGQAGNFFAVKKMVLLR